jgi:hypothetical protein
MLKLLLNTEISRAEVWLPVCEEELRSVKVLYIKLIVFLNYTQVSIKYRLSLPVGSLILLAYLPKPIVVKRSGVAAAVNKQYLSDAEGPCGKNNTRVQISP